MKKIDAAARDLSDEMAELTRKLEDFNKKKTGTVSPAMAWTLLTTTVKLLGVASLTQLHMAKVKVKAARKL